MTGADFLFMISNSSWMIKFVMLVLVVIPAALAYNVLIKLVESIEIRLGKFSNAFLQLLLKELI